MPGCNQHGKCAMREEMFKVKDNVRASQKRGSGDLSTPQRTLRFLLVVILSAVNSSSNDHNYISSVTCLPNGIESGQVALHM